MSGSEKRAVVTGAASGIGLAVAMRLLREGASVVAADRNEPTVATKLHAHDASAMCADVLLKQLQIVV